MDDLFPSAVWLEVRSLIRISGVFSLELMRCFCPSLRAPGSAAKGSSEAQAQGQGATQRFCRQRWGEGGDRNAEAFLFLLKQKKHVSSVFFVLLFFARSAFGLVILLLLVIVSVRPLGGYDAYDELFPSSMTGGAMMTTQSDDSDEEEGNLTATSDWIQ